MKMPSVMGHKFSEVPRAEIQRSQFDRSFGLKTTFDAGYLVPIYVDEALPGDTFHMNMTGFARLATPLKPIMDNLILETFFFAVPVRLVWENWQKFNGERVNPTDSTDFLIPQVELTNIQYGTLSDYLGLPTQLADPISVSVLWHRAYNLIFQEWFRDQNLIPSPVTSLDNGPDNIAQYQLRRRGKRHDYFTSCLPWPQKGDSVVLPLGSQAPITGIGKYTDTFTASNQTVYTTGEAVADVYAASANVDWGQAGPHGAFAVEGEDIGAGVMRPAIYADLSNATAATINELRQAFQVQKMLERDARGGTRYTETIKAHFGVSSPDARMQRPEYLGGGSTPVLVSPVAQTSSTDVVTPQGNLSAVGTVSWSGHGFMKSFTEHCLLLGIANVRADLTYQQGIERMFSRQTRYDFYWPALAHIGEQAVLNKEIWAVGDDGINPSTDEDVFGYQERFAEYRYKPSKITGKFRSNDPLTLDIWHLSQDFGSLPTLGITFIEEDPPVDRVIAVDSEPHFLFDAYFKLKCARPMPVFGVPGLIDHF